MLSLKPCSTQKRKSKKAFFTLCPGSRAFGFQCEKRPALAAAPPSCFLCRTPTPPVRFGLRTQPRGSFSVVASGGTPGPGGDSREGEVCGSPCPCQGCRAHPVKRLVQDVRALGAPCCATWEEGKACLEACHTA